MDPGLVDRRGRGRCVKRRGSPLHDDIISDPVRFPLPTLSPAGTRKAVLTLLRIIGADHHLPGAPTAQHSFCSERSQPPLISLNSLGRPPPPSPHYASPSPAGSQALRSELLREGPGVEEAFEMSREAGGGFISLCRPPAAHKARDHGSLAKVLRSIFPARMPWTRVSGLGIPGTHEVGAVMASVSPGSSGWSEEFCLGSRAPDPRASTRNVSAAQGVTVGPEACVPPASPPLALSVTYRL